MHASILLTSNVVVGIYPNEMENWDILEGNWDKLRLNSEEEDSIKVEEEFSVSDRIKERRSLLGKLCLDRTIG